MNWYVVKPQLYWSTIHNCRYVATLVLESDELFSSLKLSCEFPESAYCILKCLFYTLFLFLTIDCMYVCMYDVSVDISVVIYAHSLRKLGVFLWFLYLKCILLLHWSRTKARKSKLFSYLIYSSLIDPYLSKGIFSK